jgi:hypothetical protein
MGILLIIVIVVLLCGGGYGWHSGAWGPGGAYNPLGLILLILLILAIISVFTWAPVWHHGYVP